MENRSDVCTDEDSFIVDDGYNAEEDPIYVRDENQSSDDDKYVVTGKEFKKLTKKAKKLGGNHLIIQSVKIISMLPHSQVVKKFILVLQSIQTF